MDAFLSQAAQMVASGADLLEVGGAAAGSRAPVALDQELRGVVPAVAALKARFDAPISLVTSSSAVASEAFKAGAVLGRDVSGFADPDYLPAVAAAGASVVATHIGPAQDPVEQDLVAEVERYLLERVRWATRAALAPERVVLDAGLDLGKSPTHALNLLRATGRLAGLGYPLSVSAPSVAAAALAVTRGARLVRTHDVVGVRRVCATLAAVMEAGG
jgi:dihydropteroate synthase